MAGPRRAFQRFLELILDTASAKKTVKDTQDALDKSTDPRAVKKNLAAAERATESFHKKLRIAALAAGAAIMTGIVFALRKVTQESAESQRTTAQLEAVIKSTGGSAGRTAVQINAMADALQRSTAFSDEQAKAAAAVLLRFRELRGGEFDRALKLTADLAQSIGTDMVSAATSLGRALEDPETGLRALRSAGVILNDSQIETIKRLMETGDVAAAQKLVMDELTKSVDGAAAAYRDTLGGALDGLKNAWGELFEVSKENSVGIVGFINDITAALSAAKPWLDKWQEILGGPRRIVTARMTRQGLSTFQGPLQPPPREATPATPREPLKASDLPKLDDPWGDREISSRQREALLEMMGPLRTITAELIDPLRDPANLQALEGFTDFTLQNLDEIKSAAQVAGLGMQQAFQDAFLALGEEGNVAKNFLEAIFRGMSSAIIGGIAQVAAVKVSEAVANAVGMGATSLELAAKGNLPGAALAAAAAKGYILTAAKWALVGGAAGAASSAISGAGGGSFRGSDAVGRQVDKIDRQGPEITLNVYAFDPANGKHQVALGSAINEFSKRYGGSVNVRQK